MKLFSSLFVIIIMMILFSCAGGGRKAEQWISYSTPEKEGLSADSLKKTDKIIQDYIQKKKIPCGAALVAKNGKVVYEVAYGYKDVEGKKELLKNDLFRIASMSKPIVTVAALQLYEKGKIRLTDPVSKYIASFSKPVVLVTFTRKDSSWTAKPASREVTINDLLTHTSGICYSFTDTSLSAIYAKNMIPDMAVTSDMTIESTMSKMGQMPLAHEPGAKFTYGLNTDVLGRIIEVASGKTLSDYIAENITGPLKMNDTKFYFDSTYAGRLTSLYISNPKDSSIFKMDKVGVYDGNFPVKGAKKYFSGGSGLTCTMQDYFVFCQMLMNKGEYNGVRILQDNTVTLMCSDQLGALRWSDIATFGYGLRINYDRNPDGKPGKIIDLGWGGAFSTWFSINPADKVIEIIMTQVLNNPFGDPIKDAFDKAVKSASIK
jgi:CubicO group peptidase (beta-lactamase class C family)